MVLSVQVDIWSGLGDSTAWSHSKWTPQCLPGDQRGLSTKLGAEVCVCVGRETMLKEVSATRPDNIFCTMNNWTTSTDEIQKYDDDDDYGDDDGDDDDDYCDDKESIFRTRYQKSEQLKWTVKMNRRNHCLNYNNTLTHTENKL